MEYRDEINDILAIALDSDQTHNKALYKPIVQSASELLSSHRYFNVVVTVFSVPSVSAYLIRV